MKVSYLDKINQSCSVGLTESNEYVNEYIGGHLAVNFFAPCKNINSFLILSCTESLSSAQLWPAGRYRIMRRYCSFVNFPEQNSGGGALL